jgi:hypothetical protein
MYETIKQCHHVGLVDHKLLTNVYFQTNIDI